MPTVTEILLLIWGLVLIPWWVIRKDAQRSNKRKSV